MFDGDFREPEEEELEEDDGGRLSQDLRDGRQRYAQVLDLLITELKRAGPDLGPAPVLR